jgi:hypothetical protein
MPHLGSKAEQSSKQAEAEAKRKKREQTVADENENCVNT